MMARVQLITQDDALRMLAMWPYPGRTIKELTTEERPLIYELRHKLRGIVAPIRFAGIQDTKYRMSDIETLISKSIAA